MGGIACRLDVDMDELRWCDDLPSDELDGAQRLIHAVPGRSRQRDALWTVDEPTARRESGSRLRPSSSASTPISYIAGKPGVRSDFTETLYWNPLLIADADGRASIHFDLSDAVTAFRLTADAHGSGRLGSGRAEIVSRIPFNLEPKLPLEVNAGDRIDLPLAVVNDTKAPLPVELKIDCGKLVTLEGSPQRKLTLAANQRGREYFVLNVTGRRASAI